MKKYLSLMQKKTKLKCIGVITLAFISSLLSSIWPVKLGELYTSISNGSLATFSQGTIAIMTFGLIYLFAECITIIRRVFLDCVIVTHESEVREYCTEKLLKMPVAYYSDCLSGEKTAQLNQGVAGFSRLIKITCNDILATMLTAICTLVQVCLNAPGIMTGIMLVYLFLTIFISLFQIRSQNGIRENIIEQKNTLDGQICESISNLELIRSLNAGSYEKNRLLPRIFRISITEKKHHRYMGMFDCLKQFCKIAFQVVLLVISILLITNDRMPAGSVITVCLLFQQLVKPIDEVYRFMDETASSLIKARALLDVATASSDEIFQIRASEETRSGDSTQDGIHLKNVLVTNPEKDIPLALYENITFSGRKKFALKGANGSGKTSLVRCLARYYPHIQGEITLFGRKQEEYTQQELAEMIYYTPQISFFIAGTIRENLCYGLEGNIDDKELISALKNVHLVGENHKDTVINEDPNKALDFIIGEKAEELSGGMKQRLSLARAFLRKPKFYIFDEIAANLDPSSADFVLTNIEKHAEKIGAGILYISHDSHVLNRCDEIITLKNKLRRNTDHVNAA